jgi:hypothetical protein
MSVLASPDFSSPGLPAVEYKVNAGARFFDVVKTEADVALLNHYIPPLIAFAHDRRATMDSDTEETKLHSLTEPVKWMVKSEPNGSRETPRPYFDILMAYPLTFEFSLWHASQIMGLRIGKVDGKYTKMRWDADMQRNVLCTRVLQEPHLMERKYRFIICEIEPTWHVMEQAAPIGGRGIKRAAEWTPNKKPRKAIEAD